MAYWTNYRKWTSQVNALAGSDSSENDTSVVGRGEDVYYRKTVPPQHDVPTNCSDSDSFVGCHSDKDSSIYTSTSDTDDNCSESSKVQPTTSEATLRQDLKKWAAKNKCQHSSLNELLDLLRRQGHELPRDARTLLQTPRNVPVLTKCGGQYIYFGIEQGIIRNLSKYQKIAENIDSIELLINIDGLLFLNHLVNSSGQF